MIQVIFIRDLSLLLFRPTRLISKIISFANSYISFCSCGLDGATLKLQLVIVFKRFPSNIKKILLPLKVNILPHWVTSILVFIKKLFVSIELRSLISLNWLDLSGLKRLTKEEVNYGAIIASSFINSKTFSFESEIALLFSVRRHYRSFCYISRSMITCISKWFIFFSYPHENSAYPICLVIVIVPIEFLIKPFLLISPNPRCFSVKKILIIFEKVSSPDSVPKKYF